MKWTIAILALGVTFGAAQLDGGEKVSKELAKLEGQYILVKGETNGKEVPEEILKNSLLTIVGNKHTVKVGDVKIVGTHSVDAKKKPKTIDAMDTEGPYKDKTVLGIYSIKDDTFTICFAPPGKERPTEFTTKSGTGEIYHVWKRKKD